MPRNVVLLPRSTKHGTEERPCSWPPATRTTAVFLEPQAVRQLMWTESIDPRGVSNPWAPALAFEWQLETADAAATEVLRWILLGQYLDLWEFQEIRLGDEQGASLKAILREALPDSVRSGLTTLGLFTSRAGSQLSRVVAGSLLPRWCVFPSTESNSPAGRTALKETLLRERGPQSPDPLLGDDLRLRQPEHDRQFRESLAALAASADHATVGGAFQAALLRLSGTARAPSRQIPRGLVPVLSRDVEWSCARHMSEGVPWALDTSVPEVVLDRDHIALKCGKHDQPILSAGEAIDLEQLAAALAFVDGALRLVAWIDAPRNPDLDVVESDERMMVLRYRRRGPTIKLVGRILSKKDIRCEGDAIAKGPDGEATATIPIRPEYVGLIERHRWVPATKSWQVKLFGRREEEGLPSGAGPGDAGQDAGVVMWPRGRSARWRTSLVGVLTRADAVALIEKDTPGTFVIGPFVEPPVLSETEHSVAFVAFQTNQMPRGVLPLAELPEPSARAPKMAELALDFGTSSTTVLYRTAPGAESVFVENGISSLGASCLLPSKGAAFPGKSLVEGGLSVFSGWYETPSPSPLLGTLVIERLDSRRNRVRASVIPRASQLIAQLHEEPSTRVHSDLKWDRLDRLEKEVLELYLRRVLLPAYHELAGEGANRLLVAATYPLAFDTNRQAVFKSALSNALKTLAARTGVNAEEPRYFSESHAGMSATPQVFSDYVLTVDMGGGTTDFALLRGDGKVCSADSVRIGGRDILSTLCKQQNQEQVLGRLVREIGAPPGAKLGVSAETLMETLLQSSGVDSLVATVRPMQSIAVRQACIALLSAVVLVAQRLIEAELDDAPPNGRPAVNVTFLGQAWHLLHPTLTQNLTEELVLSVLTSAVATRCDVHPAGSLKQPRERKLALARGALKLLEGVAEVVHTLPAVRLGMQLTSTSAGTLSARRRIEDVPSSMSFPPGDPGFEALIHSLLKVMSDFAGHGLPIGDPRGWLSAPAPDVANATRLSSMIAHGCESLRQELRAGQGVFRRSPLSLFLSGPWREAWLAE